jgi:uncharacterized membrane protein YfcA
MDATGKLFIGIAIVAVLGAVVGFYILSKLAPRGAVLIAAAVLYFLGMSIPDNNSRELQLAEGILRLSGFLGGIMGIIDLIRKRPPPSHGEDPKV